MTWSFALTVSDDGVGGRASSVTGDAVARGCGAGAGAVHFAQVTAPPTSAIDTAEVTATFIASACAMGFIGRDIASGRAPTGGAPAAAPPTGGAPVAAAPAGSQGKKTFCPVPPCAALHANLVRFTGYVDYAASCSGVPSVYQHAWMLTHALDAIDHHARLEPMAPPEPSTLAPTDVIVAVEAAQVGWVDLIMMSGQYQHVPSPPYTPGLEYAGTVAWIGAEVTTCAVGDRVLVDGFTSGPRSLGAYQRWGGFASYAVAPAAAQARTAATNNAPRISLQRRLRRLRGAPLFWLIQSVPAGFTDADGGAVPAPES